MTDPTFTPSDRALGLDADITRRDFLNGALLAAGTPLLARAAPGARPAGAVRGDEDFDGYGGVGDYARSHGNSAAVIRDAHAMRDGGFKGGVAAARDTGETFDLVAVGGGFSGVGAAYAQKKSAGGTSLILDNHRVFGGEAKRNEFDVDGWRLTGPQGSNDFGMVRPGPENAWRRELWQEIGLPMSLEEFPYQAWAPGVAPIPISRDNYYHHIWADEFPTHGFWFDQPGGAPKLVHDAFGAGFAEVPWPDALKADFRRWRDGQERPANAPQDPQALARWLDSMTYEQFIVRELGLDPAVARYVDPMLAGAIGLGSDVLAAYAAWQVSLPGFQTLGRPLSHKLADTMKGFSSFPGGNDGIMRHMVKWLLPDAIEGGTAMEEVQTGRIRFDALDRPGQGTRWRLGSTVVDVREEAGGLVRVTYVRDGRLESVRARKVVMASGGWNAKHVVQGLPASYQEAYAEFVRAPMLVVNVALRQWKFLYDAGVTAASYRGGLGFSCNIRQTMTFGPRVPPLDPKLPTVLTFYIPFSRPGLPLQAQATTARNIMLGTTYRDYERQVREVLVRLFGPLGFDARRDVAGMVLNRWGHAYVCPAPGFYFGRDGKPAARDVIRQPFGRIAFANSELNGHQNRDAAVTEGRRALLSLG